MHLRAFQFQKKFAGRGNPLPDLPSTWPCSGAQASRMLRPPRSKTPIKHELPTGLFRLLSNIVKPQLSTAN